MHHLVEIRGVEPERVRVLARSDEEDSAEEVEALYTERDELQAESLRRGYLLPELRYAVRAV